MYSDFNKCRLGPVTLFVDFTITSGEEKGQAKVIKFLPTPLPLLSNSSPQRGKKQSTLLFALYEVLSF